MQDHHHPSGVAWETLGADFSQATHGPRLAGFRVAPAATVVRVSLVDLLTECLSFVLPPCQMTIGFVA